VRAGLANRSKALWLSRSAAFRSIDKALLERVGLSGPAMRTDGSNRPATQRPALAHILECRRRTAAHPGGNRTRRNRGAVPPVGRDEYDPATLPAMAAQYGAEVDFERTMPLVERHGLVF
jgi:hypothetical protein